MGGRSVTGQTGRPGRRTPESVNKTLSSDNNTKPAELNSQIPAIWGMPGILLAGLSPYIGSSSTSAKGMIPALEGTVKVRIRC
jgi:hypothetical protein